MKKIKEKKVRFQVKLPLSLYLAGEKLAQDQGFDGDVGKWASALVKADLTKVKKKKSRRSVPAGVPGKVGAAQPA